MKRQSYRHHVCSQEQGASEKTPMNEARSLHGIHRNEANEEYIKWIQWHVDLIRGNGVLPSRRCCLLLEHNSKESDCYSMLAPTTHSKFFSPSPSGCPQCVGLAEELWIVRLVQERDYAAVAVTCSDSNSGWLLAGPTKIYLVFDMF